MHSDASPFFASRRCISCSSVTRIRQPLAPIGWPSAIAPPLTLIFDVSQPISLVHRAGLRRERLVDLHQVQVGGLPAGLLERTARRRHRSHAHDLRVDAAGSEGLDPRQRLSPSAFAFASDITMTAAAPSLIPEALPAVTLPSLSNAGFSPPSASALVLRFTNSSDSKGKRVALSLRQHHRDDLFLEAAGVLRGDRLGLRGQRETRPARHG